MSLYIDTSKARQRAMINEFKVYFSRNNFRRNMYTMIITLFGTFILAIGDGIFLIPFQIVSGGISGLSILLSRTGLLTIDIWSYILMWSLFSLGIIFLGIKFSLNTLISTLFFPLFLTIILRTNIATGLISMMINDGMSIDVAGENLAVTHLELIDTGRLLLIGVIGGALCGIGCGITYRAGGSTGGTDILTFILNKYFNISTSTSSFVTDATIVGLGLILALANGVGYRAQFISGLVGILAAFSCAAMINICYAGRSEVYIADVISTKYEEINKFVINKLERTTTSFKVTGGYKSDEHQMLRICFNRREYMKVKDAIARIDPSAFIMFYNVETIEGFGFSKLESSKDNTVTELRNAYTKHRAKKQLKKVQKENIALANDNKKKLSDNKKDAK